MVLTELSVGDAAYVAAVAETSDVLDDASLLRLLELGFIAGEPLKLLRRGPGRHGPLAVQIGDTLLALRPAEAQCIEVVSS